MVNEENKIVDIQDIGFILTSITTKHPCNEAIFPKPFIEFNIESCSACSRRRIRGDAGLLITLVEYYSPVDVLR